MKRILLTGGGTAGHVTPNIALLPKLHEYGFEIHYIGTKSGMERTLIERENILYHPISAGKLRRYFDFKNLTDVFRIFLGFIQSILIFAKIKPCIVFSKGGFVSCPVVWAAWLFRIPVVIHESDITPGLANRLSIPFAKKICYSFPETSNHLSSKKAVHTGIPVRRQLFSGNKTEGMKICNFTDDKPSLLIICGSLGSQTINEAVKLSLDELLCEFNICHIVGKGGLTGNRPGYQQFEYVNDELSHLFALADIIISRSGATALFEFLALKKPSLLIPLSTNASRGDQILNARSFEKQGFSRILLQENLSKDTLIEGVKDVFKNRESIIKAISDFPATDSIESVMKVITETCR